MDTDSWRRARELFDQALDMPSADRAAFLARIDDDDLRSHVEHLIADLDGDEVTSWLDDGVDEDLVGRALVKRPVDGQRIGEFTVRGVLGSGGMATVLEAEQQHPHRRVALKIMRFGLVSDDARRRFDYESEILGSLQHPGIAQVFAAGTASDPWTGEELPYFAMELIDGVPLNEYVEAERCDLATTLGLFVAVCRAVEHGHQRGIIHRDLKPPNILVDRRGQTKIIDFGIARAVAADGRGRTLATREGEILGTLQYMSPEQLEPDQAGLDLRCDVYALGVVLYELVAGRRPFALDGMAIPAAAEMIQTAVVARPSSHATRFAGHAQIAELDWIVLRAMDRERDRRYPSAGELAADVERLLDDRPVLARPPGRLYVATKFVRRNRLAVAAVAVVLVSLVAGVSATALSLVRALRAESDATASLAEARLEGDTRKAVNDFLLQMLAAPDPYVDGREVKIVDVLDRAAASAAELHAERPPLATALLTTLGETYLQLGQSGSAREHLERAVEIGRTGLGPEHHLLLSAIHTLAACCESTGDLERAEALATEALDGRRALFGLENAETARSLVVMAVIAYRKDDLELAATRYERARDVILDLLGADSREAIQTSSGLGTVLNRLGRREEAEVAFRFAIDHGEEHLGDDDPSVLNASNGLATLYLDRDRLDDAAELFGDVLTTQERVLGVGHPQTLMTLNNLATALQRLGRAAEAEQHYRELIERRRSAGHYDEILTAVALGNLGVCLESQDLLEPAEASLAEALTLAEACRLPDRHWLSAAFRKGLAVVRIKQGRFAEAETTLLDCLTIFEAASGDHGRRIEKALVALVTLYDAWGKPERAREIRARLPVR